MLNLLDGILWAIATILIVYSGFYYTLKLKFIQLNFKCMFKNLFKKNKENAITPFQTLMIVLGGRIGVGSIAGIALAILLGGPGSIFWMWVIGFISAPNTFAETVLGIKYNQKDEKGVYKGGPSYYLDKGCNNKKIGKLYAIIMVISQIIGFLSIQSNTITNSLVGFINIKPFLIGLIITIISFVIIKGGIRKISKISSKLVPLMTIIYVLGSIVIVIQNYSLLPYVFKTIINSAFNFKSFGFGLLGTMIIGVQRGIFSNESGLGTGSIAASTISVSLPAQQGFVQMLGIYITTFFVCTSTAIVILTSNVDIIFQNINGIEITQSAFIEHFGIFGNMIVIISIILFSFSTVLSCYYDGESNLKYLCPNITKKGIFIFKIISCLILFFGSIISANILWKIANIMTAILAIINFYGIMKLKKEVIFELRRYEKCVKMK